MRRTSLLTLLYLLVTPACGGDDDGGADAGGSDAGVDAYVAPPPSEDWTRDILHTSLQVDILTRDSTAVITLAPSATSTGASFEVGDLEISAVHDEHGALNYERDGAQLDVGIATSEDPVELTIEYKFSYHDEYDGASTDGYTFTWPYFCGNLFPCKSDPADGLTFDLELVDILGANVGVYPASIPSDAPSYMLAWAVGNYSRIDLGTTTDGTQVAVWHLPDHQAQAEAGTELLVDAVDWLEQKLGPYPFGDTIGAVEVKWGAGMYGGMEHHPIWHIDLVGLSRESVHFHEASHGWFGNGVRIRCWEDFVLSEGPADYLEGRMVTALRGAAAGDDYWANEEAQLAALQAGTEGKIAWPDSCGVVDVLEDGNLREAPYVKGALFLRAVERRVGVDNLDAALAAFVAEYIGKAAGMQDLLDTIQTETGYDPTACATAWLRSEEAPAELTCPAN